MDMASMQALLTAAGASPGTRHRWASVGYLLQQVLAVPPTGRSSAKAVTVGGLLDACRREAPWLAGLEDFVPSDPRQVVLARLGDEVLRLAPGQVERPLADVTRWKTVAQATDSVLVPELGFGISEYVEVGLRYADLAMRALASSWPDGDVPTEGPATLTDEELVAAQVLVSSQVDARVAPSETFRAALDWATAQQGSRFTTPVPRRVRSASTWPFPISSPTVAQRDSGYRWASCPKAWGRASLISLGTPPRQKRTSACDLPSSQLNVHAELCGGSRTRLSVPLTQAAARLSPLATLCSGW